MKFTPKLLSEQEFGPGHYPACGIKSPDGKIILSVGIAPDHKAFSLYSEEGGVTFDKY